MASGLRSARPRLVWSTTPCALITGRSEKGPARLARSTTRSARSSAVAGAVRSARTRTRSWSRVSRTREVRRARVSPRVSSWSASRRRSWSTDGRLRSAVARSPLTERRLDLLPNAGNHFLSLVPPRLGRPLGLARLPAAPDRVLHEPGPELLQIRRRKALAAQRVSPLAGKVVDEAVTLGREAARLPDEIGQSRRHAYSFTSSRTASSRFASNRPVDAHWYTGVSFRLPLEPLRCRWVRIFEFTSTRVHVPFGSAKSVKATRASPSTRSSPTRPQSA